MKILILAHFYPPEMGGAAARLHGLSRWMAEQGHEVTVIAGFPNYPDGEIPDKYKGKLKANETMDGVQLLRIWIYTTPKRSSVRRILNYLSFMMTSAIAGVLVRGKYDVVLASSPPLFLGLSGWLIARLRRVPFVFDIRDIWPEVAVEAGEFAPDSKVTRLAERLARFLYKRADHITPVTENKLKKLEAAGVPSTKMTIVTNGVDLDYVETAVSTDIRVELSLENKFIILYAGLLGIAQGVDIAVRAANILRENKNIHFIIVGEGVKRDELLQQIETLQLQNVTMLPRQPREKISAFLTSSDVSLVPLVSSNIDDAVPSKLLEAWAYSRPVILSAGGEAASIVKNSQGGLVIEPNNAEQLANAVLFMRDNAQERLAFAQNGHNLVCNSYDRRILAQQMTQVLHKTIEAK